MTEFTNEANYRELDLSIISQMTGTEDLNWSDRFFVKYINFFKILFIFSILGLLLEIIM